MPIRAENRDRYPKDWKAIRLSILTRANNICEMCGAVNGERHPITGSIVVLTVAHLDHTPENVDPANLRAWCQRCHNRYDGPMRRAGIKARRHAALASGDLLSGLAKTGQLPGASAGDGDLPYLPPFEGEDAA